MTMDRHSDFPRIPKDAYATPAEALPPQLRFLVPATRFVEPTAGDGALARHLEAYGHICVTAYDIAPRHSSIIKRDALTLSAREARGADCPICNLPWSWPAFRQLIEHLLTLDLPIWLLRDTAWLFNLRSAALLDRCVLVQPTRRLRRIPGTRDAAKDDRAWQLFISSHRGGLRLLPRIAQPARKRAA